MCTGYWFNLHNSLYQIFTKILSFYTTLHYIYAFERQWSLTKPLSKSKSPPAPCLQLPGEWWHWWQSPLSWGWWRMSPEPGMSHPAPARSGHAPPAVTGQYSPTAGMGSPWVWEWYLSQGLYILVGHKWPRQRKIPSVLEKLNCSLERNQKVIPNTNFFLTFSKYLPALPGSGQAGVCCLWWQNLFFAGPGWRQAGVRVRAGGSLWLVLVSPCEPGTCVSSYRT